MPRWTWVPLAPGGVFNEASEENDSGVSLGGTGCKGLVSPWEIEMTHRRRGRPKLLWVYCKSP
ncbi:hypothetical protein M407DRAFT_96139 [Tulasnella calospora MUT 4182]|uniref:Uncharacterized protein n=1 Tax=Tulasnella calospora MUT 4182 TaxID=1051891 RepID=A0A0C3QVT9_9AGAM|nr:hypothetical protein M407DRAFT_96139 [Tulasnella calospora MUT 4182]